MAESDITFRTSFAPNNEVTPMTGQQPGPGWWQGADGRWYPPQYPQWGTTPEASGNRRNERTGHKWPIADLIKTLPLVLKLLIAIFGGGTVITITVVIVIVGSHLQSGPGQGRPVYIYPRAAQESWMSSCEGISFNSSSKCGCEFTFFENHAPYSQFEQAYTAVIPGIVPAQLAGASTCPN